MKNKLRFLVYWLVTSAFLTLIPQITLAFTYPTSRSSSSDSSQWIIIPLVVLVVGFGATIYAQRRKASKAVTAGTPKVSSIVQEKLLPGENPLKQITSGRADYVATDKRVLRFSASGFEPMDYANIASVSYSSSSSKRLAARITIGFCLIIMFWITVMIWVSVFDSSVGNISVMDAIIITLVCAGIFALGIFAWSRDFGSYRIESKTPGLITKPWDITRPPAYFGNANIDDFIKTVKAHITT